MQKIHLNSKTFMYFKETVYPKIKLVFTHSGVLFSMQKQNFKSLDS